MSLLHPSQKGSIVSLWFVGGDPVRLVHGTKRYRVVGQPTPVPASEPNSAWDLAVRDERGFGARFVVRSAGEGSWELDSAF